MPITLNLCQKKGKQRAAIGGIPTAAGKALPHRMILHAPRRKLAGWAMALQRPSALCCQNRQPLRQCFTA